MSRPSRSSRADKSSARRWRDNFRPMLSRSIRCASENSGRLTFVGKQHWQRGAGGGGVTALRIFEFMSELFDVDDDTLSQHGQAVWDRTIFYRLQFQAFLHANPWSWRWWRGAGHVVYYGKLLRLFLTEPPSVWSQQRQQPFTFQQIGDLTEHTVDASSEKWFMMSNYRSLFTFVVFILPKN